MVSLGYLTGYLIVAYDLQRRFPETWRYGPPAGAAGTGMRVGSAVLIPTSYGGTP